MIAKLAPLVLALGLVACGTNVPLNEAPVADAAAKPVAEVAPTPSAPAAVSAPQSVAPVTVGEPPEVAAAAAAGRVVYFDLDSYVIGPQYQNIITTHAKLLRVQSGRKAVIEGHTDEQGGREYNLALGQKRADAVKNALTILGVSPDQLESVSYGEEKPAVQGHDETAYAKNRRAEIRLQ